MRIVRIASGGVEAIDRINRDLKRAISELRCGIQDSDTIVSKGRARMLLNDIEAASHRLDQLSFGLKRKGYGDKGLYSALRRAFSGLFGGF